MKKSLSIILALVLVFSAFSATVVSAAAEDAKQYINYNENDYETVGQIESTASIDVDSREGYAYYGMLIKAGDAGIYKISYSIEAASDYPEGIICDTAFTDGVENGCAESQKEQYFYYDSDTTLENYYFYLEEGEETYLLISCFGKGTLSISLSFIGAFGSIEYSYPIVRGCDTEVFEDEENGEYTSVCCGLKVTFANGETMEYDTILDSTDDTDFSTADSYTLKGQYLGYDYTLEIPIVDMSDYIESIDLPEDFEPSYTVYDDGSVDGPYPTTVTINFTDGTSEECDIFDFFRVPALGDRNFIFNSYYTEGYLVIEAGDFRAEYSAASENEEEETTAEDFSTFIANMKVINNIHFNALKQLPLSTAYTFSEKINLFVFIISSWASSFRNEVSALLAYIR